MRIYFSKNTDNSTGQTCPHIIKDEKGFPVRVGSELCKQCPYCIHYEIHHSLVPKKLISSTDDWYLPASETGLKQYSYADIGYVKCGHNDFDIGSIKLIFNKLKWRVVRLFQ